MSPPESKRPWLRCVGLVLSAVIALATSRPEMARGADLDKLDSAIKEIPADAAFFSSFLRNREQVEALTNSKAWNKLTGLPAIQLVMQFANVPGGPVASYQQWAKVPENRQLLDLLVDMGSSEIFLYGAANCAEMSSMVSQIYNAMTLESAALQLSGDNQNLSEEERMAHAFLRALQKKIDRVQVPELIIGFKVTDVDRAKTQLKRLEAVLQEQAKQVPELKGKLKRGDVAGGDFLTLSVDGKMVPWEEIPPFSLIDKPEQYKDVLKKLQSLQLSLSIGVRGKYVLLALGSNTDQLTKLGKGKRLIDQPELKPLEKYADQKLTSIGYVSQSMNAVFTNNTGMLDNYLDMATALLPKAKLKPEQQAKIKKDLAQLAKEIKLFVPKPGATLDFSYISSKGYEGYTYDWSEYPFQDGSKPLTILDHVGSNPLLFVAGRSKPAPEAWPQFVRWLKMAYGYVEEYGLPQMPAEERKKAEQFMKAASPLLARLDDATGKLLIPALADGQAAFVLDAKLTSTQWHPLLPKSVQSLPILEPAIVVGVSDAAKLEKACAEYRTVINLLLVEARKVSNDVPDYQIPAPQTRKLKTGSAYCYPLPEKLGLDKRLVPNAGVSDKMAVLTISQEHTERLLAPSPLKIASGPLGDVKRPLAGAAYVDCAGFIETVAAWVEYGVKAATAVSTEPVIAAAEAQDDTMKQIRTVFQVLQCFRSHSSATYSEKGAWVTHRETVIKDLP